jgi:hypothetical protein
VNPADCYSFLIATTGSIRVALSAGIEQAKKTTADRTPITTRKFLGSYALISNSILRMNRTIMSATRYPHIHKKNTSSRRLGET